MEKKVFDDYQVNCNECERYWNDQCDSVPVGKTKQCKSFVATRNVNIPTQLGKLKNELMVQRIAILVLGIGLLLIGVKL